MCAKVCACLLIRWVILFPQSAPRRNYYHHHEYIIHSRHSHRSVGSQRQAFLSLRPRLEGYMWRPIRRATKAPARLREPWRRTTAQATAADRQGPHSYTPQAILSPCGRVGTFCEKDLVAEAQAATTGPPAIMVKRRTGRQGLAIRDAFVSASFHRDAPPHSLAPWRWQGRP